MRGLAARFASLLARGIREDAFEPAYNDALSVHAARRTRWRGVRRAFHDALFEVRALWLVLECFRLQSSIGIRRNGKERTVMATLWRDARVAVRTLSKRPLFAGVAVLTLALGIGANTAIFSVVNAVLLRPLSYADANRLVVIWGDNTQSGSAEDPHSPDTYRDYTAGLAAAEQVAGITPQWNFTIAGDGEPERVPGFYASANFLPMLGVTPVLGRLPGPEDDRAGASPAVAISYSLWQRRFGGEADILGRELPTSAGSATVVGVLPADFRWLDDADLWVPLALNSFWTTGGRRVRLYTIIARLAPGATLEQLRAQATTLATRLAAEFPESQGPIRARVVPLLDDVVGDVRPALIVLLGAVGLVLLIACANVANLLLVRSDGRRREVAVRAALGASKARLAREMMVESTVISLIGGLLGFVIAFAGMRGVLAFVPAGIPRRDEIGVDAGVLLFALGLALVTGVLFGLAPAVAAMRANPSAALKEGARGSSAGGGGLRRVLVVSEVAIALVVAVGASLLARSFAQLSAVDPGFETGRVLAMDLSGLPAPAERAAFMEQLYERVQAVPGVVAAGEVSRVPLAGRTNITSMMDVEGRPLPQNEQPEVDFRRASRGYFPAMGIDLKEGRLFESTDDASADPVALVNEVVAERHFGGKAIGQRVSLGGGTFFRIVGVTGAIRHVNLTEEPRPEVYIHTLQGALSNPQLLVRTAGDPAAIATAIRNAIRAAGSQVVISDMTTMDEIRRVSLERPRFNTLLFSLFAMLALVLSTIGVWGVMAYSVSQRAREFGVRISLGARPHDVGMMVVRDGLKLALAGIGLGVAAAFAGTRLMAGMLFGVSATDLPTYAVAAGILCTAVLLAAIASARRATRVDPVRALQAE